MDARHPPDIRGVQGLKGLENLGNTCYINATLQALAHIKPLRLYFTDTYFRRLRLQSDNSIDVLFHQFIVAMWSLNPSLHHSCCSRQDNVVDSVSVLRALVSFIWKRYPFFSPGDQHDSQEFLQCLLNDLHETLKIPYFPESNLEYLKLESFNPELKKLAEDLIKNYDSDKSDDYFEKIDKFIKLVYEDRFKRRRSHLAGDTIPKNVDIPIFFDQGTKVFRPPKSKFRSIISDLFTGELENTIRCANCDKTSVLSETFLSLSIPMSAIDRARKSRIQNQMVFPFRLMVPFNVQQQQQQNEIAWSFWEGSLINYAFEFFRTYYDNFWNWFDWLMSFLSYTSVNLIDCLENFFNIELLENENRYYCENCKKLCNGVKCIRIKRSPEVLIIHLNRYQNVNSKVNKINLPLEFPLVDFSLENFLSEPAPISEKSLYDLVAVVCHSGTQATNGHYICYALNEENLEWFEFDDVHVTYVSKDRILSLTSSAYILFYQKNDHQSLSTRALEVICDIEQRWIKTCTDYVLLSRLHSNYKDFYFLSSNDYKVPHDEAFINLNSFVLSKSWVNSFLSMQNAGPIDNSDILCPHHLIRPTEALFFNQLSLPVIEPIGRFFWLLYGGGPIFNDVEGFKCAVCKSCWKRHESLEKDRSEEYNRFLNYGKLMLRRLKFNTIKISIFFDEHGSDNERETEKPKIHLSGWEKHEQEITENYKTSSPADENCYYLISAEWFMKWLCFVDVSNDQSTVPARDRQLEALYAQISNRLCKVGNLYDDLYRRTIEFHGDFFPPPLVSTLRSIYSTMNRNDYQIASEEILKQIDMETHALLPPGPIDNWSLFGIKRKIIQEDEDRKNYNKKNPNEPKKTIIDCNYNYEELSSLLSEYLSGSPLTPGNWICQYEWSFQSKSGGVYEENNSCVFYLVSPLFWKSVCSNPNYKGGPEIKLYYLSHEFQLRICKTQLLHLIEELTMKDSQESNEGQSVDEIIVEEESEYGDSQIDSHINDSEEEMLGAQNDNPLLTTNPETVLRQRS